MQTRPAENNDALTLWRSFFARNQIEPAAYERLTQRIRLRFLQRRFKDFLPAAKPAQRRFDHLSAETDGSVGFFPRKLWELGPILMTPREMPLANLPWSRSEPPQREQPRARDPA